MSEQSTEKNLVELYRETKAPSHLKARIVANVKPESRSVLWPMSAGVTVAAGILLSVLLTTPEPQSKETIKVPSMSMLDTSLLSTSKVRLPKGPVKVPLKPPKLPGKPKSGEQSQTDRLNKFELSEEMFYEQTNG